MLNRRRLGLTTRLLSAALLLVVLILPIAGAMLAYNFQRSATTAFDQRLESLLNVVLAGIAYDPISGRLLMQKDLGDPRFDRVFSGWYWQLSDGSGLNLTSRSLWDQRLPTSPKVGIDIADISGPRNQQLRKIERDIQIASLSQTLHVTVAANRNELDAEVLHFKQLLYSSLATLGVLLLLGQAIQIRWGLSPLRRIRRNLRAVEQGELERLDTQLPQELSHLAEAINTVIERDQKLIERGRHAAGNLAHALKTPVSVLFTQAERLDEPQRSAIQQELVRLNEAVRHHLARASAAGPTSLVGDCNIGKALAPVINGIARLAERRQLHFSHYCPEQLRVKIDPQDLQEMVGNLLENACQWASQNIALHCHQNSQSLIISINDDGPGMSEEDCQHALTRGLRLDESRSGSGLGLAIANDLVKLYGGTLSLGKAQLGGLQAELRFTPNHR